MLYRKRFGAKGAKAPAPEQPIAGPTIGTSGLTAVPAVQPSAASNAADGAPGDNRAENRAEEGVSAEDSALDDFIYLVSHDLRASMRALLEVPVWIKEDLEDAGITLPEPVVDHMILLDRHTSRLDRMLFDLLAYSRVGRLQTSADIDVTSAIEQVLDEVPLPEGWTVHRDLQHSFLRFGDKDILTLLNALISNAVKHHDRATGAIWIRTEQSGENFLLEVIDDGPGVVEMHRAKVFEIMRTLQPRDQVEGSGMGLALVAKLAKIYGGTATLSAGRDGAGTRVLFSVPAKRGLSGLAA